MNNSASKGDWPSWMPYDTCTTCGSDLREGNVRECNDPPPSPGGAECMLANGTTGLIEYMDLQDCSCPECKI